MGEGKEVGGSDGSITPSGSVEDAWTEAISSSRSAILPFLREASYSVWEALQESNQELGANLATPFTLTSVVVEQEMEMNDRLASILIDSITTDKFQEDRAIAALIDWKKARVNKNQGDSDAGERPE